MKAAVIESKGVLTVKDVSKPTIGDYQCLCATQYGSVCTGTDSHLIHHDAPFCYWVKFPAILGHESVGKVIELGAKVRNLKVGDHVTRVGTPGVDGIHAAWGGFAEYTVAHDWQAMREDGLPEAAWKAFMVNQVLPPDIGPDAGTMFITWRETLSYSKRLGVGPGATVLVLGSGSNGMAMAQHAVNLGAATVVLVGAPGRADLGPRIGCAAYIDYKATDVRAQALAVCPTGFDYVLDVIGTPTTADLALSCVADGGSLGLYGLDDIGAIALKPNSSFGTWTLYRGGYQEAEVHDLVVEHVRAGKLNASLWLDLDHPFALDDIDQAFAAVRARTHVKPLIRIAK